MKVLLDGKEIPYEKNIARAIENDLNSQKKVVRKITVNETEMVNASLQEVLEEPHEEKNVEIESCTIESLIQEALSDARNHIPRLREALLSIRDLVLSGETGDANKLLDACLEGLEWFLLTIEAATMTGDYPKLKELFTGEREKIVNAFPELESAMQADDMILVSDILEYEIVPSLDAIQPEIEEINKIF